MVKDLNLYQNLILTTLDNPAKTCFLFQAIILQDLEENVIHKGIIYCYILAWCSIYPESLWFVNMATYFICYSTVVIHCCSLSASVSLCFSSPLLLFSLLLLLLLLLYCYYYHYYHYIVIMIVNIIIIFLFIYYHYHYIIIIYISLLSYFIIILLIFDYLQSFIFNFLDFTFFNKN